MCKLLGWRHKLNLSKVHGNESVITHSRYACKMCSNSLRIKLEPALRRQEYKFEHLSSYALVVHTTAKQVISRRGRTRMSVKYAKMKYARAKRAKLLFFIAKYGNLWRFCRHRRRACLNSLTTLERNAAMSDEIKNSGYPISSFYSSFRIRLSLLCS